MADEVPELRAGRLVLRGLTSAPDDVDAAVRLLATTGGARQPAEEVGGREAVRRGVLERAAQAGQEGLGDWLLDLDGQVVGLASLRPSGELPGGVTELRWFLDPVLADRGPAIEAVRELVDHGLRTLALPAVWTLLHESDTVGRNLARRLGFLDVGGGFHRGAAHRVCVALPVPEGRPHHIELWVPDLRRAEASLGWLLGELGWREFQRWSAGVSWQLGPTYLVVEQSPAMSDGRHERLRPGLNHLALHAGTRARVRALTAASAGHGWSLMFADRHPHAGGPEHYAAYLENEDGFEVELVATTPVTMPAGSPSPDPSTPWRPNG
ncbi:GNAT family N-acetyltransferase [Amycolatopsis antarctica]|uniref:GNAT family N-acetyltransferase n=1 Tax=Amycolatopsis antarctica TaxID=1854586 RepID=A0A263D3H4_9PSEU|nr:GNAT family N-acetyltransferase [Amycolatopsis antarctica]OZM73013.1 GNAT family N-acetyltransferase [Amycolatopsis antarctica]